MSKILFASSGSEANDANIKLATMDTYPMGKGAGIPSLADFVNVCDTLDPHTSGIPATLLGLGLLADNGTVRKASRTPRLC